MKAVNSWPRYASHAEDTLLRSAWWRERYKNTRAIMWDNTNVDMHGKPSDANLQRLTYSQYYAGNVAKGGVFVQLCGWLGAWELWLGGVSDTDYLERSGVLSFQKQFQELDTTETSSISFTNILDKGYRSVLPAWASGGQKFLQPVFAKSDRQFSCQEVLESGEVAADRSANG